MNEDAKRRLRIARQQPDNSWICILALAIALPSGIFQLYQFLSAAERVEPTTQSVQLPHQEGP